MGTDDIEVDLSIAVDIWVIDADGEGDFGRAEGEVGREAHITRRHHHRMANRACCVSSWSVRARLLAILDQ